MQKRNSRGYIRFIISTLNQSGECLVKWSLDQSVSNIYDEKQWTRIENQVNRHLHDLSKTTGCVYKIEVWGEKSDIVARQRLYCMEVY